MARKAKKTKPKSLEFQPTDKQRNLVKAMCAVGVLQDDIASLLRVTAKTLRKHFRHELDHGMMEANAAVGGALFTAATTKGPSQVTAAIYWTKVRMGWREPVQSHEHTGKDGKPIEVRQITRIVIDPRAPDTAPKADQKAKAGTEAKAGTKTEEDKT